MKIKNILATSITSAILFGSTAAIAEQIVITSPETPQQWYAEGKNTLRKNAKTAKNAPTNSQQRAKNIILFIGDGMGISTLTAARIFEGQTKGLAGEEHELFFEKFPNLALAKTYNTNQQTPDSAGTMTAMMTGVKTKAGVIGVNENVTRGDCASQDNNELVSALELAEIIGMSTGIISTARITHATPAATYAHVVDRNFEDDRDASKFVNADKCTDIAQQLIDFPQRFGDYNVDGLEVALGGGRRSFLKREDGADPETGEQGEREDGRDLTQDWLNQYQNAEYVWNQAGFKAVDPAKTEHLLGLFESSHMQYNHDRKSDTSGEPSLSAMTKKAVQVLNKNDKGFFLMVESGRIDHAHHASNPYRALNDTVEFAKAVKTAYNNTNPEETLIIVTADHSHVFTIAGYPTRGNPILGKVVSNDSAGVSTGENATAADGNPYTTLGYTNGRGFQFLPESQTADAIYAMDVNLDGRADLTDVDTTDAGFHPEVVIPLDAETHAAEDVAIYATGPGSSLVNGLMEQNALYHVMNRAAKLENRAKKMGFERTDNQ